MFGIPTFTILLGLVLNVSGGKILGIFHIPGYSHSIIPQLIVDRLAKRGHEITTISSYPINLSNNHHRNIQISVNLSENIVMRELTGLENKSVLTKLKFLLNIGITVNENCLNHTSVQNLLSSNEHFDLVILDWTLSEAMLGFAHHFKAPIVLISTIGSTLFSNKVTTNPSPYSYVSNLFVNSIGNMIFLERVVNTLSSIALEVNEYFHNEPAQDLQLHQYFPDTPSLQDLMVNVSLVLLNSHLTTESIRPYVPNMIQVAGLQIQSLKPLPEELQTFMDDAHEGFIYFSLGGNINSTRLPRNKLKVIIETFKKLPLKVVWKLESNIFDLPPNIKVEKWIPQHDVLAHPNLKVFLTHGGLFSTIEAIYHKVPMVGIPCYLDQRGNIKYGIHRGYSIMIELDKLTKKNLYNAVMDVATNRKYKENIKKYSSWLRDQPISPVNLTLFWTEYVLRHKGTAYLQTDAAKLKWYQYFLLDIVLFLMGITFVLCYVVFKIGIVLRNVF
ncbi:hypothetical protein ILUMI_24606 [Ignelater luminosus]|uniref:UDP-glucuronosyltransferase n=1 Tax=Ignelater luminosus TaxID=2038154 RepID=A0A8K0C9W9_IGNLU|nr:hypothetical protein ILUMI_24606 [Ignelater luminosus]